MSEMPSKLKKWLKYPKSKKMFKIPQNLKNDQNNLKLKKRLPKHPQKGQNLIIIKIPLKLRNLPKSYPKTKNYQNSPKT